ncbi:MAG TPA: hypothetical protein VKB51_12960 [bacterium]|nr:hypothetical protein [bacterium]
MTTRVTSRSGGHETYAQREHARRRALQRRPSRAMLPPKPRPPAPPREPMPVEPARPESRPAATGRVRTGRYKDIKV